MRIKRLALGGGIAALIIAGCGIDAEDVGELPCASAFCDEGDDGGNDDAGDGDGNGDGGGNGDAGDAGDDAGDAGDDAGDNDDGSADIGGIPCDIRDALAAECHECHAATPSFGAPMPLADYDDFHVPSIGDNTRPVHEVALERVASDAAPMPPGGAKDPANATRLTEWLAAGAPEDPTADCDDPSAPPNVPDNTGVDDLPCVPDTVFAAHSPTGGKFKIPEQGADDMYQCFAFQSPFTPTTQATAWAPVIDDDRVVHHWILYKSTDNYEHGSVFPCDVSLQLSADFVAGWAPGGENTIMPDEAGLELGGPGTTYVLQVHYNNSANYPDAEDNTGVAFCTTDTPRPNTAGILTTGTININVPPGATGHETTGTCGAFQNSGWPQLHVIATSPHMHEFGRAFYTQVQSGAMITNVPQFDFNQQLNYFAEPGTVLNPGDAIYTTCVFDNPTAQTVTFGEGTGDEMC
ncbi:MAG: hypothetical protein AAF721_03145, partial [Myxococcota bacterium]